MSNSQNRSKRMLRLLEQEELEAVLGAEPSMAIGTDSEDGPGGAIYKNCIIKQNSSEYYGTANGNIICRKKTFNDTHICLTYLCNQILG